MNRNLLDKLCCPQCKEGLTRKNLVFTTPDEIWAGHLFCEKCDKLVGEINYGRVDFIRKSLGIDSNSTLPQLHYQRFGWSADCVKYENCRIADFGWNAEGYSCALQLDSPESKVDIELSAYEAGLRFLTGKNCGKINISIDNSEIINIDLDDNETPRVASWKIYSKDKPLENIAITSESTGREIYFFGIDAALAGESPIFGGNKGNGFPAAYQYLLEKMPKEALVLDCGSGDRQFPDKRVVSFEYMDFAFPGFFGDSHNIPFKDNSFDIVFSQAVMEHMRDPYLAAREISRILKPGGLVYCESAFMQPLHGVPYHFFNTTPDGLKEIFIDADIYPLQIEWFGSIFSNMNWIMNGCNIKMNKYIKKFFLWWMKKIESSIKYQNLKYVASGVAFFGRKGKIDDLSDSANKNLMFPTFKY